jgi:hypothetical protein
MPLIHFMQQPGANLAESSRKRPASARDLIGGPIFWAAALTTLAGLIAGLLFAAARGWIGVGVLFMWTTFSATNAVRSRRLHSIVSTPVYCAATAALAGLATGRVDVQIWMIWLLGAGMISANLSERVFGRYV